ncbi:MAG: AAA family ATPase [Promethearchaeota archaeon]
MSSINGKIEKGVLKRIRIKNFGVLGDVETTFDEKMTVLIGKNKIGKTTLLNALSLVEQIASINFPRLLPSFNKKLLKIIDDNADKVVQISLDFYIQASKTTIFNGSYNYTLELEVSGILSEKLIALEGNIFKLANAKDHANDDRINKHKGIVLIDRSDNKIEYCVIKKSPDKNEFIFDREKYCRDVSRPDLSCFTLLWDENRQPYSTLIRDFLMNVGGFEPEIIIQYRPYLQNLKEPLPMNRKYISGPDYLSILLHHIKKDYPELIDQLEECLELLYDDFIKLDIPREQYADIFRMIEDRGGKELNIPSYLISDGTKKVIYYLLKSLIATKLNNAHVIVIEEIENSLHPKIIRKLLYILRDLAVQFIITTHNPLVLHFIKDIAVRVFIERDDGVKIFQGYNRELLARELGIDVSEVDIIGLWMSGDDSDISIRN